MFYFHNKVYLSCKLKINTVIKEVITFAQEDCFALLLLCALECQLGVHTQHLRLVHPQTVDPLLCRRTEGTSCVISPMLWSCRQEVASCLRPNILSVAGDISAF